MKTLLKTLVFGVTLYASNILTGSIDLKIKPGSLTYQYDNYGTISNISYILQAFISGPHSGYPIQTDCYFTNEKNERIEIVELIGIGGASGMGGSNGNNTYVKEEVITLPNLSMEHYLNGSYRFTIKVDPDDELDESDETNNIFIQAMPGINFAVTGDISPISLGFKPNYVNNDSFKLTGFKFNVAERTCLKEYNLKNSLFLVDRLNNWKKVVDFYDLNTKSSIFAIETYVHHAPDFDIFVDPDDSTSDGTWINPKDSGFVNGPYRFGLLLDADNEMPETNENNNKILLGTENDLYPLGSKLPNTKITSIINNNLKVYPNPSSDVLNIILEKELSGKIYIYNKEGQLIFEKVITEISAFQLDLKSFNTGAYNFKIETTDNQIFYKTFIKI